MKKEDMQELKNYCDKIEFYTVQQSVNQSGRIKGRRTYDRHTGNL